MPVRRHFGETFYVVSMTIELIYLKLIVIEQLSESEFCSVVPAVDYFGLRFWISECKIEIENC